MKIIAFPVANTFSQDALSLEENYLTRTNMSPLRKVLYFGLKSSNVLVINNPGLKAGVRQIARR